MDIAVFFDIDGLLANFVSGALAHHGRADIPHGSVTWGVESQLGLTPEAFWRDLGHSFWSNLAPYPDGMELLTRVAAHVGAERIGLLTSPCETAGCVEGKREWVARYLPDYRRRLFVGSAKHLFASPTKILIDDHNFNVDSFTGAGGLAVMPPRPWNRLASECKPGGMFCPDAVFASVEHAVNVAILRTREPNPLPLT